MSRTTVSRNDLHRNLEEERLQVFKGPAGSVPTIVIAGTGASIHHEIDATSSPKDRTGANHIGTTGDMRTGLRNMNLCRVTIGFEMMGQKCGCTDERVIAIVSSGLDDEDLQTGELFGQSACDDTSGCAAYIN